MLQASNVSAEVSCLLVYFSIDRVRVCVYVCVVFQGNSICFDADIRGLTCLFTIEMLQKHA